MQRRTALKNIGLSFGAITLSSTVVGLFESCQTTQANWTPEFFTPEQADLVSKIVDVMLPKTQTPGAKELNISHFMDGFMAHVASPEDREFAQMALPVISILILEASSKTTVSEITNENVDEQLNRFLRADQATQQAREEAVGVWSVALSNGEMPSIPEEGVAHAMLNSLRRLAVYAFKNNEVIGETVLAYAPVPGEQKGCISLEEATGGRAWSL